MSNKKRKKPATSFSTKLFQERLKKVDSAIKKEDWFSAFTNIVTYFEHYGYWAIAFHCLKRKVGLTEKAKESLKRLGASDFALMLRILNIIDNEDYSIIKKTIEERNKIVHPSQKGIRYIESKKKEEASKLLNEAKECLKKIQRFRGET